MGLLQKLKSALGLDGATSSGTRHSGDVDVTVEREPSTEDEDAVKGTDTAESSAESDASTSAAESDPVVTDDTDADAEPDEPDESDESETDPEVTDDTEADDADDAESADADADASDDEPQGSTDPVTEIKGIGPAYAERLHGQDIETVGELADADPAAVAAETDLGEGRVSDWVERASEY